MCISLGNLNLILPERKGGKKPDPAFTFLSSARIDYFPLAFVAINKSDLEIDSKLNPTFNELIWKMDSLNLNTHKPSCKIRKE